VFPWRAALELGGFVARQETRKIRSLARLTASSRYVRLNSMRAARLQEALERLTVAMRDVESELASMKAEHDPLASHIFVSRRSL
jgi:hypothetical protein